MLYIQLKSKEQLSPTELYNVIIKLLCDPTDYNDSRFLETIQKEFNKLLQLFDTIGGVVPILGSQVQSQEDFSIYELQSFKAWDNFDYISFSNESVGQAALDFVAN